MHIKHTYQEFLKQSRKHKIILEKKKRKEKEREKKKRPQILIGALRWRREGWERKIWRALTQSCLISPSESWTCLLPPLPSNNLLIISSNTPESIIPSIVIIMQFLIQSGISIHNYTRIFMGFDFRCVLSDFSFFVQNHIISSSIFIYGSLQ